MSGFSVDVILMFDSEIVCWVNYLTLVIYDGSAIYHFAFYSGGSVQ